MTAGLEPAIRLPPSGLYPTHTLLFLATNDLTNLARVLLSMYKQDYK